MLAGRATPRQVAPLAIIPAQKIIAHELHSMVTKCLDVGRAARRKYRVAGVIWMYRYVAKRQSAFNIPNAMYMFISEKLS